MKSAIATHFSFEKSVNIIDFSFEKGVISK